MATNLAIDDSLIEDARRIGGHKTTIGIPHAFRRVPHPSLPLGVMVRRIAHTAAWKEIRRGCPPFIAPTGREGP